VSVRIRVASRAGPRGGAASVAIEDAESGRTGVPHGYPALLTVEHDNDRGHGR
jgi:hypothetical protein